MTNWWDRDFDGGRTEPHPEGGPDLPSGGQEEGLEERKWTAALRASGVSRWGQGRPLRCPEQTQRKLRNHCLPECEDGQIAKGLDHAGQAWTLEAVGGHGRVWTEEGHCFMSTYPGPAMGKASCLKATSSQPHSPFWACPLGSPGSCGPRGDTADDPSRNPEAFPLGPEGVGGAGLPSGGVRAGVGGSLTFDSSLNHPPGEQREAPQQDQQQGQRDQQRVEPERRQGGLGGAGGPAFPRLFSR